MRRIRSRRSMGAAAVAVVLVCAVVFAETAAEAWKRAQDAWDKHNYKEALNGYGSFVKLAPTDGRVRKAGLRICICHAKLGEWDEALKETTAYTGKYPNTIWQARGYYFLGKLYAEMRHYGWKTGSTVSRARKRPPNAQYVNTYSDDRKNAIAAFEKSREIYLKFARELSAIEKTERATYYDERITLNFKLAQMLSRQYQWGGWRGRGDAKIEPLSLPEAYSAELSEDKKVLMLFDEVVGLDKSEKKENAALASYRKAMYLATQYGTIRGTKPEIPAGQNPVTMLEKVEKKYRASKMADDARYARARLIHTAQDFVKAEKIYGSLIEDYPQSQWVSDCRSQVQNIKWKSLSLGTTRAFLPGSEPKIQLASRNIKNVALKAEHFKLEKFVADTSEWARQNNDLSRAVWSNTTKLANYTTGTAAEWKYATEDRGEYKHLSREIGVPVKGIGAYLITASADGVIARNLVIVSDLAIMKKTAQKEAIVLAVDAVTGAPVNEADLTVGEWFHNRGQNWQFRQSKGRPAPDGLYRYTRTQERRWGGRVQAFAHAGEKRYALTTTSYWNSWRANRQHRTYCYTDRPVYRPGQTVHFKQFIRLDDMGTFRNVSGQRFRVKIRNPKGEYVFDKVLTANDAGSVTGEILLGEEPPLGVYTIETKKPNGQWLSQRSSGNRFRVEEYKKPEFEVSVTPEKSQVKLGGDVSVMIGAKYYFGAPVTDAKVKYRVFRDAYSHRYTPPGLYDWFYGRGYGRHSYWGHWYPRKTASSGELIKEGEGKIGKDGTLKVTFDTADAKKRWPDVDHRYRVTATVTDASRRAIDGSGAVTVTRNEFYLYVSVDNGFYRPGDKVKAELKAMTPSSEPLEVKGTVSVYSVKYQGVNNDKEVARLLYTRPAATDAAGRAFFTHESDQSGQYKIVFKAKDNWGNDVLGEGRVWIAGDDFSGAHYRFRDIEVLTDKRTYQKGETAHVMLNSNFRDSHVLFTSEVNYDLMSTRLLHLPGKSKVIDVEVQEKHVPNFFLQAALVRNGQVHAERREIFVPPAEKFLDVEVTASKDRYLPGETGELTIKVAGPDGEPVNAEVSVAVFDKSVLYIQSAFAPEIRKFFYGDRRHGLVNLWHSFQVSYYGRSENGNARQRYRTHGNPPDWGQIWGHAEGMANKQALADIPLGGIGGGGGGQFGRPGAVRGRRALADRDGAPMEAAAAAKPMAAPMEEKSRAKRKAGNAVDALQKAGADKAQFAAAQVRKKFADTAYWKAVIATGADGVETIKVAFPDNLTTWQAEAKAATSGTEVGQGSKEVVTSKNLLVRMQAPRFFVEKDEVVLSANVHNYLAEEKTVRCVLELPKGALFSTAVPLTRNITVEAGGEKRVDWRVKVMKEGLASLKMSALTDEESDAVQMSFPVYVHGAEKFVAHNDAYRVAQSGRRSITVSIPKDIKASATELEIVMQPSLAGAMLDALPYLLEYPYGCTEQTMSRFLPAVVVSSSLSDMGVKLEEIAKKQKQLSDRQIGRMKLRRHWKPGAAAGKAGAVYSTETMKSIVRSGMGRLYSFQKGDGGWGWWKMGQSDPYMSAYVLYGLSTARKAGYAVEESRLKRAVSFLKRRLKDKDEVKRRGAERLCYIAYALSHEKASEGAVVDELYEKRDDLNLYGKALLAMTLHNLGQAERADIAMQNIEQFLKRDRRKGTAYCPVRSRHWWYWYNNEIETNAYILKAAAAIHPKADYLPELAKWLITHREGARWSSTKETAMCIFALADYMKNSGELSPDYDVEIDFDGTVKKVHVDRDNMFAFDNRMIMLGDDVRSGTRKLNITKKGGGALYFSCFLKYFTKEEGIKGAGHGIEIKRTYHKLTPKRSKVVTARGEEERLDYDRAEINDGDMLTSGDEIEVTLEIASDNDYEYVVFEDFKPAGCEPTELKSGHRWGGGLGANMELRDEKVAFFVSWLAEGKHKISYRLRAEIPGKFHALPTNAYAMYAPKVRAISDEKIFSIKDADE